MQSEGWCAPWRSDLRRTTVVYVQEISKNERGPSVLTTATGSFTSGSMAAGLITSRVKPETDAYRPLGERLAGCRRALTFLRIAVDCAYSSRITSCWWRKTLGDSNFGLKLGARWSGLCSVDYAGIWAVRFEMTEPKVASTVHR